MRLYLRSATALLGLGLVMLTIAPSSFAEQRAGVVTTIEGKVTVARASLPEPALLKFRDEVFVRDRVTTGQNAVARILLGGRAVVTVREHSTVTITEVPGVSTIDVSGGRVAVAVARERMRPGDRVEVRTPNAVAGIRGTVIVAEVWQSRSVITVLKGVIDVTRLDAGRVAGPATVLNALQQVTVVGAAAVPAPQAITSDAAQRMGSEFRMAPPKTAPSAATVTVNQAELDRTARDLGVVTASAPVSDNAGQATVSTDSDKGEKSNKSYKREKKGSTVTASTSGAAATSSSASSNSSNASSSGSNSTGGVSLQAMLANNPQLLKSFENFRDVIRELREAQREALRESRNNNRGRDR